LSKLLEYLGFGGGDESKFPAKDQGRRGIWLAALAVLGVMILIFSGVTGGVQGTGQPTRQAPQGENSVERRLDRT
jgi:hypothetical protein